MQNEDIYRELKIKIDSEMNSLIDDLKNSEISHEFYDGSLYMSIAVEKFLLEIINNTRVKFTM